MKNVHFTLLQASSQEESIIGSGAKELTEKRASHWTRCLLILEDSFIPPKVYEVRSIIIPFQMERQRPRVIFSDSFRKVTWLRRL